MARLIYIANTSLDGYIEDRDGRIDFTVPSLEVFATITELIRPVGTYLYGRRMYETMAVWDTAHVDPGSTAFLPGNLERERDFASLWRAADKVVFSTSLSAASTPRTRIERTFDAEQVRRLKRESTRDLTVGGPGIAAAMFGAGLVDELHAFVYPVILGGGKPWLPAGVRVPLELATAERLGSAAHVHYRVAR
ncbi:MAG TPA: dihydrofolate reductase family protein [Kofleriaceae bacterium]|nr:dihydrofolate reductase family protein [Kofleriaceae bacterium]